MLSSVDSVYAIRSESARYIDNLCGKSVGLGPEERRHLIGQMLNLQPETIGWKTERSENIEFKSAQQFYANLQTFIAAEQAKYRDTATALAARNLMTPAEAQEAIPQLNLYLLDMRGRGQDDSPIAKPPFLPPHVTWSTKP